MKKNLKLLFEYQKFDQNDHLNRIIVETQSDVPVFVVEEALSAVAGGNNNKKDEESNKIVIK